LKKVFSKKKRKRLWFGLLPFFLPFSLFFSSSFLFFLPFFKKKPFSKISKRGKKKEKNFSSFPQVSAKFFFRFKIFFMGCC